MGDRKNKPERMSVAAGAPAPKVCISCGRTIEWRKKWERDWEHVRYCSDACRAHKPDAQEAALEAAILQLLHERGAGKTICPSEASRLFAENATVGSDVAGKTKARTGKVAAKHGSLSNDPAAWEPLMEPARAAARRLVAKGSIVITQSGHVVDPSTAKGPIRLRLA